MEDEIFAPSVLEVVFLAVIALMLLVLTGALSAFRKVKRVFTLRAAV